MQAELKNSQMQILGRFEMLGNNIQSATNSYHHFDKKKQEMPLTGSQIFAVLRLANYYEFCSAFHHLISR